MSTPESIVTDLEHARMLKEAGFPQEACSHYWMQIIVPRLKGEPPCKKFGVYPEVEADDMPFRFIEQKYAAPTASELLHHIEAATGLDRQDSLRRLSEFVGTAPERNLSNDVAEWWCFLAKNGLLPQA